MNCKNKNVPDQATLLMQIAECEFTCIDLNQYLDTHADNERALADYNCYAQQLAMLKDLYVSHYGPLENFGNSVSEGSWKWKTQTWPWDQKLMEE